MAHAVNEWLRTKSTNRNPKEVLNAMATEFFDEFLDDLMPLFDPKSSLREQRQLIFQLANGELRQRRSSFRPHLLQFPVQLYCAISRR